MTPLNIVDLSLILGLGLVALNTDVLYRCRASNAKSLMLAMGLVAGFTCIAYFVELNGQTLDGASVGVSLEFVCGNLSLFLYYLFIADWCQVKVPTGLRVVLTLEVALVCLAALPGRYQYLLFTPTGLTEGEMLPGVEVDYGPLEYVNSAVQAFMFVSTIVMSVRAHHAHRLLGDTSILVLFTLSAATPFGLSIMQIAGVLGSFDPSPLSSIVTLGILTYCIVRRKAFDALPRAFETIVTNMPEVVCVLDSDERVLFANRMAKGLWGELAVGDVLPPEAKQCLDQKEFFLDDRFYQTTAIGLSGEDAQQGLIATATDITNLKHINNLLESEQDRMRKDLVLATAIQTSSLPSVFPPWPGRIDFDIFASMNAAKEVGGDLYDFFLVDETHLGIVIADVSGKGMPAALVMMSAKSYIKDHMMAGKSPALAFELANDRLCGENGADMFLTAWALLIDLQTGHAQFANAGHNPPLIRRAGSTEWQLVNSRPNLVLADSPGLTYRTNDLDFGAGDTIYLYTDGVTEAMDESGELFGVDRLRQTLELHDETDPNVLLPTIRDSIASFVGDAEQSDDITMLGLRINLLSSYLRVPATFSSCEIVSDFIHDWLVRGRFPDRFVSQVMVVQDEAFSNVMRYAYKDAHDATAGATDETVEPAPAQGVRGTGTFGRALFGEATVELTVDGEDMVLRLIDAGVPFDPLKDNTGKRTSDDELKIGGDGITLIKGFMDELAYGYVDGQNVLTMRKRIPTE